MFITRQNKLINKYMRVKEAFKKKNFIMNFKSYTQSLVIKVDMVKNEVTSLTQIS